MLLRASCVASAWRSDPANDQRAAAAAETGRATASITKSKHPPRHTAGIMVVMIGCSVSLTSGLLHHYSQLTSHPARQQRYSSALRIHLGDRQAHAAIKQLQSLDSCSVFSPIGLLPRNRRLPRQPRSPVQLFNGNPLPFQTLTCNQRRSIAAIWLHSNLRQWSCITTAPVMKLTSVFVPTRDSTSR